MSIYLQAIFFGVIFPINIITIALANALADLIKPVVFTHRRRQYYRHVFYTIDLYAEFVLFRFTFTRLLIIVYLISTFLSCGILIHSA